MTDKIGYNPETGEYVIPFFRLRTDALGEVVCNWYNSVLKSFIPPVLNHLEYVDEEGKAWSFQIDQPTWDRMQNTPWPEDFRPIPDDNVMRWIEDLLLKDVIALPEVNPE